MLVKEELLELLEKLKEKIVIVEGKKDRSALQKLGLTKIVILNKPLFEICEEIYSSGEEVAILTDLDSEGKKLYSKIKDNLDRLGVKIDNTLRNYLFKETDLRQIEGLDSYIDKL